MKLQKAVRQETVAVAAGTGIGCIALILLFLIVYLIFPQSAVRFDYRVVLGALCGGAVAVANFFLMAVTVQNVVNVENRDDALRMMRVSYRNRMLMRGIWIIVAIFAPCFHYAAGIIPLFIPSLVIKIRGIRMGITGKPAQTAAGEEPGSSANVDADAAGADDLSAGVDAAAGSESAQSAEAAGADADAAAAVTESAAGDLPDET